MDPDFSVRVSIPPELPKVMQPLASRKNIKEKTQGVKKPEYSMVVKAAIKRAREMLEAKKQ
jgi:hypothetical protein